MEMVSTTFLAARSSNQKNETDQRDQMNQLPATRIEMVSLFPP